MRTLLWPSIQRSDTTGVRDRTEVFLYMCSSPRCGDSYLLSICCHEGQWRLRRSPPYKRTKHELRQKKSGKYHKRESKKHKEERGLLRHSKWAQKVVGTITVRVSFHRSFHPLQALISRCGSIVDLLEDRRRKGCSILLPPPRAVGSGK